MKEILDKLHAIGISAERKSIYDDIAALKIYGLDIVSRKGKTPGYLLNSRKFNSSELRLLVDAVAQSSLISKKASLELINKLAELASTYERKSLRSYQLVESLVKSENEEILNTVDIIASALTDDYRISFLYFDTDVEKRRTYHNEGKAYILSPYLLKWDNQNYYLIGRDEEAGINKTFRVDKMCSVSQLEDKSTKLNARQKDRLDADAAGLMFGMYAGERVYVTLECRNNLSGVIIDRFGRDVELVRRGENFQVRVSVCISPQFYSWVFGIGEGIRIVSPQAAIDGFLSHMQKVNSNYS